MRIHHIALYAENLEDMKSFYETYFGAISNALYHNPKTGLKTYFFKLGDGCKLEIMARPDVTRIDKGSPAAGYAHLALSAGGKAEVNCVTDRLRRDGYTVVSGPRVTGDGYYESCVLDPEGNPIEIVGDNNA